MKALQSIINLGGSGGGKLLVSKDFYNDFLKKKEKQY